ncbi:hypothetical protein ACE6H2_026477 [Prunus campanulata]
MWKQVWRLRVPNKVKLFLWRALQNALPCRWALTFRHIGDDSCCPRCHGSQETIIHVLWGCREVKRIWNLSFLTEVINIWHEPTFADLWCHVISMGLNFDLEVFAYLSWLIWFDRDARMHGQKVRHPDDLYATAHRLSVEFISANTVHVRTHPPSYTHWCPPPPGKLKLNVDGACSTSVWKRGLGAVVRNVHGDLMSAISVPIT